MNRASTLSANESLKSKILRRVREAETGQQGKHGRDQLPEELASETMDASSTTGHIIATRKQSSTGRNSRPRSRSTRQNKTRKTSDNPRSLTLSLRSSSRTRMGEPQEPNSLFNKDRGRPRGRRKSQISKIKKEASQSSSLGEAFGDSREAKPRPTPVKRRLRSSTSLVSAPLDKVRRVEGDPNKSEQSTRSPSPNSTNTKASLVVPESPCCLVIVEKKSPGHQRKISVNKSAEPFCACTEGASCGHSRFMKSGRKKKSKVRQTKRKFDSCPGTETLSKKMVAKSNLSRNGVSKQKKKRSDADAHASRPTRRNSKTKDEKMNQVKRTSGSEDQLINFLLQDSVASNSVAAAMSSVISQTSSETVRKEHGSLVRELINKRINLTLTTQNDQNNVEDTTNAMTVTKTAATEAAKAVGGISLVPLYKAKNPDFLPTVSSPCTPTMTVMKASSDPIVSPTMTVMKASSDPIVSPTMSSESNLKDHRTQVSNGSEAPQLSLVSSGTSSGLQPVAQCKCVSSVSTVPTPSLRDVGSAGQAGQPIFLSPESFQFQTVSYPGMVGYNLPVVNSSGRLPKSSSRPNKKRGTTKKKSVEKEPQSLVSSGIASSSSSVNVSSTLASSPPNSDTKDPSLDDKGEKIKRPMNAFMIWSRQQRSILAGQRPKMTNADISVKLGVMWNDLDYSVKQQYFDEAIQLKLQHRKDYPDWVYQPRPQKRQGRRKRQPNPFYGDGSQQMPCNQMVLVMPDGQRILCPAIPQPNLQGPEPMVTNFASNFTPVPAVDVNNLKNIPQPPKQAPGPGTTNNETDIAPRPTLDGKDVKNSANHPSEQSKSKMLVLMPDGTSQQVFMCPAPSQQNCKESEPVTTNIISNVTPGPLADVKAVPKSDKHHTEQSKMVLIMPDGKQVLCPVIPGPPTDVNDVKQSANQPSEQSKSSKEKLVVVRSENSGKCGDNECLITFKGKPGLSNPVPINLGPVIQLAKDATSSNKNTDAPLLCIPEVKPASSDSQSKQQQMAGAEKKFVTLLQMAAVKDRLGTSQGQTEPVVTIPQTTVQSNTSEVTETKTIEAKPFPTVNTTMAQVQSSYEDGDNQSIAKQCEPVMMMLSNPNQQRPLTEISSLLRQPANNGLPTQNVSDSLKERDTSSRPHPADVPSGPQRQPISVDDSSRRFLPDDSSQRFVPDDSSQLHPAVTLVPLDLQEPDLNLQPLIKETGVQTLQDWSGSCSSNDQNIVKLPSHFPSSILKNQPIDMVWNTDPRIVQLPNISHKGTSTTSSYPFYFTPVQQASGVQGGPTAPLLNPPALPATVESCMVPLSTASLTVGVATDVHVGMPSTQFADTPTLCEISEPDRLLESLAMSGVEISEDEAEETENLFQRVMNMVSN